MRKPFIICILIASTMLLPACMSSDKIDQKLQAQKEQLQQQQSGTEMSPEEAQELIEKIELYTTPTPGMARAIIDENRYIDIDINAVAQSINEYREESRPIDKTYTDNIAIARAANYRYFSHVKLDNGKYTVGNITAKDLNMSESTFEAFQKGLEEFNASLSTMNADGMEMDSILFPQEELDRMLE